MGILIAAIVSFLAGLAFAYWLVEKRLNEQKQNQLEQTRKITEEIERSHQSRIQETVRSLQASHEQQLRQRVEELEQTYNTRMEEAIQSLQEQHDAQLVQVTDELQKNYESQITQTVESWQTQLQSREAELQEAINRLKAEYEGQLQQATETLARSYDDEKQATIERLQTEYETQLGQIAEQVQTQEAQSQISIKTLQDHYETQLKEASQALQTQESQSQENVRILQQHYEGQLDPATLPEEEVAIDSRSAVAATPTLPLVTASPSLPPVPQNLSHQIALWGNSSQIGYIPQLIAYSNHQSAEVRHLVAVGLGKIAMANSLRVEMQRVIPVLGKLARDIVPQVRLAAVEALGAIKSDKAIPLLQLAQRDADRSVSQSASAALRKFKYVPQKAVAKSKPAAQQKPKR